ncbi:laminin subunit alpha-1-like [Arapaima gigas]
MQAGKRESPESLFSPPPAPSPTGLFPAILNLASNAEISTNATCGESGPEMYCKLVEHVPGRRIRNPQCRICDGNSTNSKDRHGPQEGHKEVAHNDSGAVRNCARVGARLLARGGRRRVFDGQRAARQQRQQAAGNRGTWAAGAEQPRDTGITGSRS